MDHGQVIVCTDGVVCKSDSKLLYITTAYHTRVLLSQVLSLVAKQLPALVVFVYGVIHPASKSNNVYL